MKVSVMMITYNHEAFISQALDSVLMQEVNFEYEIVIGEDNSTDNTKSILLEYKKKYPDKIKLIIHDNNVGMHRNFELTFNACVGEYIAVLEGDDYWIDKDKLQKQVNLMEKNQDLTECFHKVTTMYQDGNKTPHQFPNDLNKCLFDLKDVVSDFFIPTLSIMFRKSAINKLPVALHQMANPDWLIHILCAEKGNVGFIDEVMGVYRVHVNGVWSGISRLKVLKNTIQSASVVNKYLNYQFDSLLKNRIAAWHLECFLILLRQKFATTLAVSHFSQFVYFRIYLLFNKFISRAKY